MKIVALGYEAPTTCQPVSRSTLLALALSLGGPSRCVWPALSGASHTGEETDALGG